MTRGTVLVLALLFAVAWFAPLGFRSLMPIDEGRYAEAAREMLASGDWVTPRYDGYVYYGQAPLQIWATAASFALFGLGEWQARLWTALCGFGTVILICYTGVRLFGRPAGILAAVALAATPYWHLMGHFASADMGLSAMWTLALCALMLAQRPLPPPGDIGSVPGTGTRGRRGWMWTCWTAMALAALSAGAIGIVMPALVVVIYSFVSRDFAIWRRLYLFSGALLCAALCAPWCLLVQERHPGFLDDLLWHAALRRFVVTTPAAGAPDYTNLADYTRFAFFLPVLLIGLLPWLSLLWQSIRRALRLPRQPNRFSPACLLVVWAAVIVAFFSGSAPHWVSDTLPVTPALALLLGAYLPTRDARRIRRHLAGYAVLLISTALGVVYLSNFGSETMPNAVYRHFQAWLWLALAVALLGLSAAAILARRLGARSWIVYAAAWYAALTIAGNAHELMARPIAGVALAARVSAVLAQAPDGGRDRPFYMVGMLDDTMPFYLRRTLILVGDAGDLSAGVAADPAHWIASIPQWEARWRDGGPAYAMMRPAEYRVLHAANVPMSVIAHDTRRVIVSR